MKCPFCGDLQSSVVDSRLTREEVSIRRRRECASCEKRFTTYERVEDVTPFVIKKDGTRVRFDRMKVIGGVQRAVEKRPVSAGQIDSFVMGLEAKFQEKNLKEVTSTEVGQAVMEFLRSVDQVAYVRFASVYRSFRDVEEFMDQVRELLDGSHDDKIQELESGNKS